MLEWNDVITLFYFAIFKTFLLYIQLNCVYFKRATHAQSFMLETGHFSLLFTIIGLLKLKALHCIILDVA